MRAHAYGCFCPLLCNGPFRELRRLPEDNTYGVSKHIGDLLASDVYILVHVIFFTKIICLLHPSVPLLYIL
jgi:hypothetical protein